MDDSRARELGATWADVALAVVQFAREETLKFCVVILLLGLVIWMLFPRATKALKETYEAKIKAHRAEKETKQIGTKKGNRDE